jgi:hypothetical protein
MQTWLKREGITGGVWVIEFQKRGALHFHVLLMEQANPQNCQAHWNKIIGNAPGTPSVHIEPNRDCLRRYLTKTTAKDVPCEYFNMGKMWGAWGTAKLDAVCTINDPAATISADRLARKYDESKRRERLERDMVVPLGYPQSAHCAKPNSPQAEAMVVAQRIAAQLRLSPGQQISKVSSKRRRWGKGRTIYGTSPILLRLTERWLTYEGFDTDEVMQWYVPADARE